MQTEPRAGGPDAEAGTPGTLGARRGAPPPPRLAATRGRWLGPCRGRRLPFARNPCRARPPLPTGRASSTPAPKLGAGGERGRSHLSSSPLPWRAPRPPFFPGHCCDSNWGSCQRRLGVWEPLLIGFMCESPPAQPGASLKAPPGPTPAPLDLHPSPSDPPGLVPQVPGQGAQSVGFSVWEQAWRFWIRLFHLLRFNCALSLWL